MGGRADGLILELRIHGVNNTLPAAMLDLPSDNVEQVDGDELGSFWRAKPGALDGLTGRDRGYVPPGIVREAYSWGGLARSSIGGQSAIGKVLGTAGRLGWSLLLPFGLVNVAYWSRRLASGASGADTPGSMQPLDHRHRGGAAALRLAGLLLTLLTATTASVLALDFLAVQCFADRPLGVTSAQVVGRCEGLPSWSEFLYSWSLSRRMALLELAPLLLIVFLWYLANASRNRYERATRNDPSTSDPVPRVGPAQEPQEAPEAQGPPEAQEMREAQKPQKPQKPRGPQVAQDASGARPRWPLLSTPGFWDHSVISSATAQLHLAAVAVLLTIGTAWHLVFGEGPACNTVAQVFGSACRVQVRESPRAGWLVVIMVLAVALLAAVVWAVVVRTDDAADIEGPVLSELPYYARWIRSASATKLVVRAALALFVAQSIFLAAGDWTPTSAGELLGGRPDRGEMAGSSAILAILVAVLLGVSVSALTWRFVTGPWPLLAGLAFAVTVLLSGAGAGDLWAVLARAVAVVSLGSIAVAVFTRSGGQDGPTRRYEIWGGCGPGVALILALLLAMTMSSAVVVVVGNVLNGNYPAASLAGIAQEATEQLSCTSACGPTVPIALTAPRTFVWFGATLLVLTVLVALILAAAITAQARRGRPGAAGTVGPAGRPDRPPWAAAERGSASSPSGPRGPALRGGHPMDEPRGSSLVRAVRSARAFARHAHRAEKTVALVAYAGAAALLGALSFGLSPWVGAGDGLVGWLMGAGMWALSAVGAGVVGAAVGAGSRQRPLGLVWDLICFLPRAGHPFGPPCYAERVVPELLGRYHWWLTQEGRLDEAAVPSSPRRVLLSAHSLGGVLATATILASSDDTARVALRHVSLLTYGCQLRAYFSRFFPELLGPDVLGSPACRAADGSTWDPWQTERADRKPARPVAPGSVRGLLGGDAATAGRWLNLWRLTDYLGFPVHHYPPGLRSSPDTPADSGPDTVFDHYAQEVDRTAYLLEVLDHLDYPRSGAYAVALAALAGPSPSPPDPSSPPDPPGPPRSPAV